MTSAERETLVSARYFLGINSAHDAAACIVGDDGIVCAIREERLSRRKYHEGFPRSAIRYCLDAAGLSSLREISGATISQYPKMNTEFDLMDMGYDGPLYINPSHHLLHARYAQYFTGGRDCLIVVADGSGYSYAEHSRRHSPMLGDHVPDGDADEAETIFAVHDGRIDLVRKRWGVWKASTPYFRFPSLGHAYAVACQHIYGNVGGWQHAGKVMGLAPLGEINSDMPPMVTYSPTGFEFDLEWFRRLPVVDENPEYWKDPARRNIAARAQHDLEAGLLNWFRDLASHRTEPDVCLTGGVAHNSCANGKLVRQGDFRRYHFTPAADDAGISIGGALYAYETSHKCLPAGGYKNEFHGRRYNTSEIDGAIRSDSRVRAVTFDSHKAFAADAAASLATGSVVALFDGASEFSARALGHRSILCDPRGTDVKPYLNRNVKFREEFRPYAAMVLEACAREFFEIETPSPYMMMVADVQKRWLQNIPAVCHVDGTCRVQTVGDEYEGAALAILKEFHALTGMPMLLNTSFNIRGEPIVETPQEALECLCTTGLHALYMYPFRVEKLPLSWDMTDPDFLSYVPLIALDVKLECRRASRDHVWMEPHYVLSSKTGHGICLAKMEYDLLTTIDDNSTVGELGGRWSDRSELLALLRRLNEIGAIAFSKCRSAVA